jgi:hypothetical protein
MNISKIEIKSTLCRPDADLQIVRAAGIYTSVFKKQICEFNIIQFFIRNNTKLWYYKKKVNKFDMNPPFGPVPSTFFLQNNIFALCRCKWTKQGER